ncbi:hypothetical protein G7Y89_g2180 [Cudoniella acicularis]|uniref:Hemerythrin-like domain-containing protein n=1 Tax=Cudoniella acicularis TaxID=354080 RepID=A0A8H4W9K6_9HELO|nr:hypothetical protein G7Y89_g2180 [Cudoniella acicularis]
MRPHLLTLSLSPLPRSISASTVVYYSKVSSARFPTTLLPALEYPTCRRNFTCSAPSKQNFPRIMADQQDEAKILEGNEAREEAVKAVEKEEQKEEVQLPKLSAAEFRVYNSMAEHMEYFHNRFRQTWTTLHTSCVQNRRAPSMSLKTFLSTGLSFCHHLSTHHAIEEQHIFPILRRKMPEFRNTAELLQQHKDIHKGMDLFEAYLESVRSGERELELSVMKEKMDCWGGGPVEAFGSGG